MEIRETGETNWFNTPLRVTTNIPPVTFSALGLGDSRFNWLSRLSIIPRNKYTNIAVPNPSEIPKSRPTANSHTFSLFSPVFGRISSFLRIKQGEIHQFRRTKWKTKEFYPRRVSEKEKRCTRGSLLHAHRNTRRATWELGSRFSCPRLDRNRR